MNAVDIQRWDTHEENTSHSERCTGELSRAVLETIDLLCDSSETCLPLMESRELERHRTVFLKV